MPERRIRKASSQRAIVMDNFDPDRIGRVRVKYPWQKDIKEGNITITDDNWTPWIRVSTPMASKDAGMLFIPAEGDEVLVDFENENVEFPYVNGAFYSDSHRPSVLAQSQTNGKVKSITSTNGHHIAFFDNGSAERYAANFLPIMKTISSFGVFDNKSFKQEDDKYFAGGFEISDYHGIYSIKGSTHNRSIDISSPFGDVSINAFQGITINAPLGDVKIVGKNVSIEARNNLTLESGTNIKNSFRANLRNGKTQILKDFIYNSVAEAEGYLLGQIDLNFFRNYLETILRPIGGTMLLKSNRYMRLEAGGGETTQNIHSKDSLIRYLSKKNKLRKAKEEALLAYTKLENFRKGLVSAIVNYVENPFKEDYNDVEFFNGDKIKNSNQLEFVSRSNGYSANIFFKQLIYPVRDRLEKLCQEKSILNGNECEDYRNEVNRLWDKAKDSLKFNSGIPKIDLNITKRQLVYFYLKSAVENDNDYSNNIEFDSLDGYEKEDIEKSVQSKIQNPDTSFLTMLKDKCVDSLLDYSGIANLVDDNIWCISDDGAILFSDDKNTFFKIDSDGTLKKGFNNEDRDEFLKLMNEVIDD